MSPRSGAILFLGVAAAFAASMLLPYAVLADLFEQDPDLAGAAGRARLVPTDGRRWTCLGPLMIDEILRLRGALAS